MSRKDWIGYRFLLAGVVMHSGTVAVVDGDLMFGIGAWLVSFGIVAWGVAGLSTLRDDEGGGE